MWLAQSHQPGEAEDLPVPGDEIEDVIDEEDVVPEDEDITDEDVVPEDKDITDEDADVTPDEDSVDDEDDISGE